MRYLLLRLRSRLVAAYDRQSRKRQFANADRADQTTRRPIGVVKPSHDRWIDIRRPHRFCYGRLLRFELGRAPLMAWEWAWIPMRQTAHLDRASPRWR